MKATVTVRLKPEVLDPQGRAVLKALDTLGLSGVQEVRVGRLIELELDSSVTKGEDLDDKLRTMCDELLANTVIEDFEIRVD